MSNSALKLQGEELLTSKWAILFLGVVLPLVVYFILPAFEINTFATALSMDVIIRGIVLLIAGTIFLYIAYLGGTKYFVLPVCALFLYQTLNRFLGLYGAFIHINFRATMLIFILPVMLFVAFRYRYNAKVLLPFLPVLGFYLLNVIFVMTGYMHAPNTVYSPDLYTFASKSLIPRTYGIELTVYYTFLAIALYTTANIFYFQKEKAMPLFNKFVVWFLLITSTFCVSLFLLDDPRMINTLAGIKRLGGISTHTNIYAFFTGCMILYVIRIFYSNELYNNGKRFKLLCTLSIIAGSIATLLTYSRSNNALLILFILANVVVFSKNKMKAVTNIAVIGLIAVVALGLLQAIGAVDIFDKIASRLSDDSSTDFRPRTWEYLKSQLQWDWRFFFGQGIGAVNATLFNYFSTRYFVDNEQIIYHPHNAFFQVFFDYGIVGLLGYFGTLFTLLWIGIRNVFVKGVIDINALILIELILYALIASMVDAYVFNQETLPFWIMITILYTQVIRRKEQTATDVG